MHLSTDVLVIGAGGAGMYAAIAAARAGVDVILADKNMIGRGGATIMAQMTVAAALSEEEPDTWEDHLADTLAAGRGLCDETLAEVLCRNAPERMREMDEWGVGWARADGPSGHPGRIRQIMAPGHGRRRCCYVDFLNTGPAVAGTLRKRVGRTAGIRALSNVAITDLVVQEGSVRGALGFALGDGAEIEIAAGATVIATGRAHQALCAVERLEQHGGRRLCPRAARGRGAGGHGVRAVLPDRPPRAAPSSAWTPSCGTPSATSSAAGC